MFPEIFTRVDQFSYYRVQRFDPQHSQVMSFGDHTSNAKGSVVMMNHNIIPTLVVATDIKFGIRSADDDPNIAWQFIIWEIDEISLNTMRTGGTILVVTQETYDFLLPYMPPTLRVQWVVHNHAAPEHVLISYHGFADADGGYPVKDNGDGTSTLYDVHDLDIQYYRSVHVCLPDVEDDKTVYLNWS